MKMSEKERVKIWQKRVVSANKVYEAWADKYKCNLLEDYWLGLQWNGDQEEQGKERYVINKVFPSIETRIPSLLFYYPQAIVRPKPARSDDMGSDLDARGKLLSDTLNTFIQDRKVGYKFESTLALRESFFRFGVIEIGYTADLVDNPLLNKPELTEDEKPFAGLEKIPNPDNPQPESVYVRRVPARQWRVSTGARNTLGRNDWCGYYSWEHVEDVKANPRYKNNSKVKPSGKITDSLSDQFEGDTDEEGNVRNKDMVKVWKIWDLRTMMRYVFDDGGEKFFIDREPFKTLPFAAYKPHEILDSWYPLPPVYNWIYPQNELNEIREMQRIHRRRFYRRYTYRAGAIDEPEIRKLEDGGDGVYAKANVDDPIRVVPDAPLDFNVVRSYEDTNQDFREVTGIGDEQRGEANPNTTATQANLVELRLRIRESYSRLLVGEWLADAATILARTIIEKMKLAFWVKINCDPHAEGAVPEALSVAEQWKRITSSDIEDLQYDVSIDVTSLSPVSEEGERVAWTQVLALLTNPALLAVLMASEVLLKKTLSYYNIKSQREIAEIKKAGTAMLMMLQAMAAQKAGGEGAGGPQGAPSPGPTPSNIDIAGQLTQQMGGVQ